MVQEVTVLLVTLEIVESLEMAVTVVMVATAVEQQDFV
tara:strand:- start:21 stop:134 length:114 start_codon:yes stop_codon:yes gene_type:complete